MTARPFEWRQVPARPVIEEAPPPPTLLDRLDVAGFAAAFGPALARIAGRRISATPETGAEAHSRDDPATAAWLRLATFAVAGASAPLELLASPNLLATLAETMFGGRAAAASETHVEALPPDSATWVGLAGQIAAIVRHALRANGLALPDAPFDTPARAVRSHLPRGAALLPIAITLDGARGRLLLADHGSIPPEKAPAATAAPDPRRWRRDAQAGAMEVNVPVALRLEDLRMPLAKASALRPGDIIPIGRPRKLGMMVAGQRIRTISADEIGDPLSEAQDDR